MRTLLAITTIVIGVTVTACGDDLQTEASPGSIAGPTTTLADGEGRPASSTEAALETTTTTPRGSTATTMAPTVIEVPLQGPAVGCDDSIDLRWSDAPDKFLGTVHGDSILQITGSYEEIAILTTCDEAILVTTGSWSFERFELGESYLVPPGANEQMRFRWFGDPLLLEEADWLPALGVQEPLPSVAPTTLTIGPTNGLVGNTCGEPVLAQGVVATDGNGAQRPWAVDGIQIAAAWAEGDFIANDDGDFAIVEPICTDDGTWSRLVLGTFDAETGDLLEFRRLDGFERWSTGSSVNHRGPTGLALADDGEILIGIGTDLPTAVGVSEFCASARPLRPGGTDWALFTGGVLRRQLHHCKDGQLYSSVVVDTEGTVFWAADVNDDGVDEVFVGGTSVSAGGGDAWTLVGDDITPIYMNNGQLSLWDGSSGGEYGAYGCVEGQFAQLLAMSEGDAVTVTLTLYTVEGESAHMTSTESVEVPRSSYFSQADPAFPMVPLPFEDQIRPCL